MAKIMLLRIGILMAAATLTLPARPQEPVPAPMPAPVPVNAPANPTNWQNVGSDIPVDENWRLGTLPNGLRFAVRRNGQQNMISIRLRIGVGALMESDAQQGWTHLIEHMTFRRSANFPDGEGSKIWQRLGVRFGSDTNAFTSLGATNFVLDLPKSDADSYRQAMAVLADMVDNATIDPADLAVERKVVIAESAARFSPSLSQVRKVQMPLFHNGTKAAVRDVIGTEATLAAATPEALRAYYEAWYRPSNAVLVVVANADPAALEAGIRAAFAGWKATGPQPADPDWGMVKTPQSPAAVVVQPQAPESLQMSFVTPHDDSPFTLARLQRQFAEVVARNILNERLGRAALKGEAIVNVNLGGSILRHGGDQTTVQITPRPGQWKAALDQCFSVLNGAKAEPPAQEEIDEQTAKIADLFRQQVANAGGIGSSAWAGQMMNNVENGEVTMSPAYSQRMFAATRPTLTPALVGAVIRDLLKAPPRLLVLSPTPIVGGNSGVIAALTSAQAVAAERSAPIRAVSLDQLELKGMPATVVTTSAIPSLGTERIQLSNGMELVLKRTAFEKDHIRVAVQLGNGLLAQPRDDMGLQWSANALAGSGIGPFSVDEIARLAAGRQITFGVAPGISALTLSGVSNGKDVGDMLKLMAGQVAQPRFIETQLNRLRASVTANYNVLYTQPASVLQAFAGPALYGGDKRFQNQPPLEAVQRLNLPSFQKYWGDILAQGPRRVVIVGDFDREAIIAAVLRTLGTITAVHSGAPSAVGDQVRATPPKAPVILRHRGNPSQALVMRAFPTLGALEDRKETLALSLTATLVETRLMEGFREQQGGTYTPSVALNQAIAMAHYGLFTASAQTLTTKTGEFDTALNGILADLAANGPSADAFKRAKDGALIALQRSRSDNSWWVGVLQDELTPARMEAITDNPETMNWLTPDDIKAVVAHYLLPAKGFSIEILPTAPARAN